jgi:hypothetical protein
MSSAHRWSAAVLALVATMAVAAPVSAQQRPSGDEGAAPLTSSMRAMAPTLSLVPVMVSESANAPPVAPMPAMRRSQSVALMIVGGAGMIVGSLIDGDTGTIIMVGGGVIGLVGLFQYLR